MVTFQSTELLLILVAIMMYVTKTRAMSVIRTSISRLSSSKKEKNLVFKGVHSSRKRIVFPAGIPKWHYIKKYGPEIEKFLEVNWHHFIFHYNE